jgi:hypothetical protein
MSRTYESTDPRELAHALMAVLRFRRDLVGDRRLTRGELGRAIGRGSAPSASGTLIDLRTGRVVVAAEAVDPFASSSSIEGALERVGSLAKWARGRADESESNEHLPELWICAPAPECVELEKAFVMPLVRWVSYDASAFRALRAHPVTPASQGPAPRQLERTYEQIVRDVAAPWRAPAGAALTCAIRR